MIDDPLPHDWKDLQTGVCRLLNEVGLSAVVEKTIRTARGEVTIDVYAVDENSVDRISYIVECKNWSKAVPQHVVHSFTTVMHECGANIGFIVSKQQAQAGALRYTDNTNIECLTYQSIQERYFPMWWKRHFCRLVADSAGTLFQYVEPINSLRQRVLATLSEGQQAEYHRLQIKYLGVCALLLLVDPPLLAPRFSVEPPASLSELRELLSPVFSDDFSSDANTYRAFLTDLCSHLSLVEQRFNTLFGRNIFELT